MRSAFVFAGFLLCVGAVIDACASFPSGPKEVEAESKYGAEQFQRCVAVEPILGSKATRDERIAAWDRVDKCRVKVQAEWGIVEVEAGAK